MHTIARRLDAGKILFMEMKSIRCAPRRRGNERRPCNLIESFSFFFSCFFFVGRRDTMLAKSICQNFVSCSFIVLLRGKICCENIFARIMLLVSLSIVYLSVWLFFFGWLLATMCQYGFAFCILALRLTSKSKIGLYK